jgi:hypothetical protein
MNRKQNGIVCIILLVAAIICCRDKNAKKTEPDSITVKLYFLDANYIDVLHFEGFKEYANIRL